jgi:hypothetical protein
MLDNGVEMQTSDRAGVECDFCKILMRNDFKYYSLDFYKVKMFNGRKPQIHDILRGGSVKSCDLCAGCYETMSDKVVDCYSLNMNSKTGIYKFFCEFSGESLLNAKMFYYVTFACADVKIDSQPVQCVKCGKAAKNTTSVCVCGCDKFSKQALVQVEEKILEINISDTVYNDWIVKVENIKSSNQWSSSS